MKTGNTLPNRPTPSLQHHEACSYQDLYGNAIFTFLGNCAVTAHHPVEEYGGGE